MYCLTIRNKTQYSTNSFFQSNWINIK
uniref:Uncharacterized protein n=1 Tax=Anguilla anguilla TaxID=7936 RepID=A0A0E9Y0G5_ANGAN